MANTYTFIGKSVLSSSTNVISLTSIPSTYTDLMLMISCRSTGGENTVTIGFNSAGQSANMYYKAQYAVGAGTAPVATVDWLAIGTANDTQTANNFSVVRCYIQNYASSSEYKTMSAIGGNQSTDGSRYTSMSTASWENAATISSIQLGNPASQFAVGSAIYLYGISKE